MQLIIHLANQKIMSVTRRYFAKGEKPTLTTEQLAEIEALKHRDIDLSDAPEVTDWSNAVRGRFTRDNYLKLDDDVLNWVLKNDINPNEILRQSMKKTNFTTI
ncbi:MAG: toxin-antitoxin system, antitoxin component [Moraxellaceae bacterium]|nr:toxin-antitoxin system, antitoxin component [Moraxellaceae bacterium]